MPRMPFVPGGKAAARRAAKAAVSANTLRAGRMNPAAMGALVGKYGPRARGGSPLDALLGGSAAHHSAGHVLAPQRRAVLASRQARGSRRAYSSYSPPALPPPGTTRTSLAQHGKKAANWVRTNARKHPGIATGMGMGALGVAAAVRSTGRPTDKTGYTTGMYGY